MIKIVTAKQMREMDTYTIEQLGIPGVVLMENAAKGTFFIIENIKITFFLHCTY